jgi:hypothetical protein
MRSSFFGLLALVLALGCSSGSSPKSTPPDGGGGGICPAHPANCDGKCCGSVCANTALDVNNCGACNNVCPKGLVCANGTCGCLPSGKPCAAGSACCGSAGCVNLMTDALHCGDCMTKCDSGLTCVAGKCGCGTTAGPCPAGQRCCSSACTTASCGIISPDLGTVGDAGGSDDSGVINNLPPCDCTGLQLITLPFMPPNQCPLSNMCVAHNCCFENTQGNPFLMSCQATPTVCMPSPTPQ